MASIKLPDGSIKEVPDGTTVAQLAESIGKRLAQAAIVGKVDGKLVDLSYPLTGSARRRRSSPSAIPTACYVMRHSTAHVLAQALRHLYGSDVQYTIGPVIENGFFYDFELPKGFSAEDLPKVEAEMQKIIDQNLRLQPRRSDARQRQGTAPRGEPAVQRRNHRRAGAGGREDRFAPTGRAIFSTSAAARTCRTRGRSRRSSC